MELIEGCNWYATKRDYFTATLDPFWSKNGREGYALCSGPTYKTQVMDQVARTEHERRHYAKQGVVVADLPLCKHCIRRRSVLIRAESEVKQ